MSKLMVVIALAIGVIFVCSMREASSEQDRLIGQAAALAGGGYR
jgi:hypothetical protein